MQILPQEKHAKIIRLDHTNLSKDAPLRTAAYRYMAFYSNHQGKTEPKSPLTQLHNPASHL